jgi:hypothetical protein
MHMQASAGRSAHSLELTLAAIHAARLLRLFFHQKWCPGCNPCQLLLGPTCSKDKTTGCLRTTPSFLRRYATVFCSHMCYTACVHHCFGCI